MLFAILAWMFWRTKARYEPGKLVGAFILFYGMFRFAVEFVREPDAQLADFAAGDRPAHGPVAVAADDPRRGLSDGDRRAGAACGSSRSPGRRASPDAASPTSCAQRIRDRRADQASRPIWPPATRIITRPAIRWARRATSPPRPKSARCSARWSARRWPIAGTAPGAPANAIYAELGPGRGTLAADALRVMRSAGFAGEVHLVETSPALARSAGASASPARTSTTASRTCPPRPLLLVANEFFDALPVRQWIGDEERRVDRRRRATSPSPPTARSAKTSPARDAAVAAHRRAISPRTAASR